MEIIAIAVVVIAVALVLMYNTLIKRKNGVENIWGSVDAQLKKRYDLIPNMVETVKQYMEYERGTLNKIVELREKAISTDDPEARVKIENELQKNLGSIMVKMEAYPELRSSENMLHLQKTLSNSEEEIAAARRAYNQAVTDYNNAIEMVPTNFMAMAMGYTRKAVFEIDENERATPNIRELMN